ncbi:prolipoprotein diacylglyceryl transferase [Lacrimispora sp.]|jgi:phosphatidylglycerol:prolipoprotein diacylglycerol transferase|uniref:prolipoprotein diacylglyceryl transferase n=1 Tax=Lacrimispora sp. TaxID=2719234 RepID=UPI0029DF3605|nr:phosphatidylglycerol---prolipoprotein diacylglyceryl transferase [Lacrimispora sp.]
MYNDIVTIGPITIHGYGLMIAIGIFSALLMFDKRAKTRKLDSNTAYRLSLISLLSGFIGAKLLYCIIEFETMWDNPWSALSGSGFVVYGGIISGIATAIIYCRIKNVRFFSCFDLAAPSIALAQGFGRIGCLLAGCCYGRETNSAFGIVFDRSLIAPNGVKLIPTQLLSSAGDFMIAAILLLYARKERKQGRIGALYLILYGSGRFAIEFFRNDDRGYLGVLSTSQFLSLIVLILAVLMLYISNKTNRYEL